MSLINREKVLGMLDAKQVLMLEVAFQLLSGRMVIADVYFERLSK